jgi:pimeloyl-ACP methyl ester carboxylesterase
VNVIIVPGYGDIDGYIKHFTGHWSEKYGVEPYIHRFGSTDPPELYDQNWQRFVEVMHEQQATAVIGISFGFSIAARALVDYPDQIRRIVSIAGPHDISALKPDTVQTKYPMLGESLGALKKSLAKAGMQSLPSENIMTLRPLTDRIIDPKKVTIEGAKNHRIPMFGHNLGIPTALAVQSKMITDFLQAA